MLRPVVDELVSNPIIDGYPVDRFRWFEIASAPRLGNLGRDFHERRCRGGDGASRLAGQFGNHLDRSTSAGRDPSLHKRLIADVEWTTKAYLHLGGDRPDPRGSGGPRHRFVKNGRDDSSVDDTFKPLMFGTRNERRGYAILIRGEAKTESDRILNATPKARVVRTHRRQCAW